MTKVSSPGHPRVLLVHRSGAKYAGPRTVRAERLSRALQTPSPERDVIDLVFWPVSSGPTTVKKSSTSANPNAYSSRPLRSFVRRGIEAVLIDRLELTARLRASQLPLEGLDAALLVSFPASFSAIAASNLQKAGIPYVVDQGDPWGVGKATGSFNGPFDRRLHRAERRMWQGAAGGVLTTESQAEAVLEVAPDLPILIRPNGFREYDPNAFGELVGRRKQPDQTLRLAHFGSFSRLRVDIGSLLRQLDASELWQRIVFTQFGGDWRALPDNLPPSVRIEAREEIPWDQVRDTSVGFDAAIVVGWDEPDRNRLPSKVVEYQTLPIPRLAFCALPGDELSLDSVHRPGFLRLVQGDPAVAGRIKEHLQREWTPALLAPSQDDSWEAVANEVTEFFLDTVGLAPSLAPGAGIGSAGQ